MIRTNFLTRFPTANKWRTSLWLLLFSTAIFAQKSIPPVSDRLVSDYANVLSAQEEQALEQKLVAYDDSSSTQIAVVIENSLDGDDLFDYSQRLAESWGIGREGKSNGVLIYVAVEDRKVRIHTGYGVEGFLPDALASRIIRNLIVPEFRNGNYYAGLDRATDAIIELGKGEYTNDALDGKEIPIGLIIFLIILVIVVFIIISKLGGGGGYYRGGRYDNDRGGGWIIFGPGGGGWHSGGSGGSGWGGGGGFGGFGGGGFGGGGASGGW